MNVRCYTIPLDDIHAIIVNSTYYILILYATDATTVHAADTISKLRAIVDPALHQELSISPYSCTSWPDLEL